MPVTSASRALSQSRRGLRVVLGRLAAGADPRDQDDGADQRDREAGRQERQRGREVGADATEGDDPEDGDGDEVDRALDQEEGDRAARDVIDVHAALVQDPGAERQSADTAGGNDRAHRQLGAGDLPGAPHRHPAAEDRREHEHVGAERERLEGDGDPEPARLRVAEPVADLAQAGRQQDDQDEHPDQCRRPDDALEQRIPRELTGDQRRAPALSLCLRSSCDGPMFADAMNSAPGWEPGARRSAAAQL